AFALQSHTRAVAAADAGRFADEIVPVDIMEAGSSDPPDRPPQARTVRFDRDEGPRRDTSAEALARLQPAFHAHGTVTAGNSSQTSDGAAAVVVMAADRARALGITPLARFVGYATAGVAPERFGLGPVPATRKLLSRLGLKMDDLDLIEMNEAFAAQVLACLDEMPIDPDRLNVNGGAIALGHPLGCTGARLTTSLVHEMGRRGSRYGLVTLCIGGGMGAAAILERWS
ncbi:MAG TPA: thiolase family protein, partial [Vicinamibacterales bacterium]|nr:thiolase family protein [Vicinamibacterales bacterium]